VARAGAAQGAPALSDYRDFYRGRKVLVTGGDEKHLLNPTDVNGIHKISGEFYHLVYHSVHGIRSSSLGLTNTYGPRQLIWHSRQGFIGWFVRQALLGEDRQKLDIGDFYGDTTKIRTALAWSPRLPLREGLAETLAYHREHKDHYL
jgi:nucleoside-diphosphate-sugar epimerase